MTKTQPDWPKIIEAHRTDLERNMQHMKALKNVRAKAKKKVCRTLSRFVPNQLAAAVAVALAVRGVGGENL